MSLMQYLIGLVHKQEVLNDMTKLRRKTSVYEDRYTVLRSAERDDIWYRCFYCGLPANGLDHVPPLSRVDDYMAFGLLREEYWKVPCCKQCNNLAGTSLQETLLQRVEHVKDKLRHRLRRDIEPIEWDDDELDELGPTLQAHVSSARQRHVAAVSRLDYYGAVDAYISDMED